LVKAPDLPAINLAECCYESMFDGCTALVDVHALSATYAEPGCYQAMFRGCEALTNAPEIFLTNIEDAYQCLVEMFKGCKSLNYIKIHYTGDLPTQTYSTKDWLYGVSNYGDAYFNGTVQGIGTGDSIPPAWLRHNFEEG